MHLWCITVSGERNVQAVLRGGFVQLGRKNRLQLLSVKRPTDSGPIPQQTRAEQNISWIRALACLAPMDFHLVSPYVFEVHDCSALHVCSFILSILHQASFFFCRCDFRRIKLTSVTSVDKKKFDQLGSWRIVGPGILLRMFLQHSGQQTSALAGHFQCLCLHCERDLFEQAETNMEPSGYLPNQSG